MSTADRLRALMAALPDEARNDDAPWRTQRGALFSDDGPRRSWILTGLEHEFAAYLAAVASPPVVLALADHMDAMARLDWVGSDAAMDEHLGARRKAIETYRALDAALNREPQT